MNSRGSLVGVDQQQHVASLTLRVVLWVGRLQQANQRRVVAAPIDGRSQGAVPADVGQCPFDSAGR